jgi:hypothetical protein
MNSGRGAGMARRLAVIGVLAILAALVPATALAGPSENETLSQAAAVDDQSSWQSGATANAADVAAAYPADCIGVSDYPHLSEHNPGYVAAQVRTECSVQRGWMYARGKLYRDRWYGPQLLSTASSSTKWTYGKVRAIPSWKCYGAGKYTYRIYGYHEVDDWYKSSSSSNTLWC